MLNIKIDLLPQEVRDVWVKIKSGFVFSHPKDGSIYRNRERLLPEREFGYYREYAVPTPTINNRGARRLVVGNNVELYYTEDHYQTFVKVIE
jgi:guanyl-specific ribonuclease Sa